MVTLKLKKKTGIAGPEFRPKEIQKAVIKEAVKDKATLIPSAIFIITILTIMIADPGWAAYLALLASGGTAAGSWVVNFFLRTDTLEQRHTKKLDTTIETEYSVLYNNIPNTLELDLKKLMTAYRGFIQSIKNVPDNQRGRTAWFRELAEDARAQGFEIIERTSGLQKILNKIDTGTLHYRLSNAQDALKVIENSPVPEDELEKLKRESRIKSFQNDIQTNLDMIKMYQEKEKIIVQLISKVDDICRELESVSMQVGMSMAEDVYTVADATVSGLQAAVESAREADEYARTAFNREIA